MLWLQVVLLKITGILPLSERRPCLFGSNVIKRLLSAFLKTVAACILLGTFFSSCLQGAVFSYGLFHPVQTNSSTPSNSPISVLFILKSLPFFCINIRGLFVIFLFFIKQNKWIDLMRETQEFIEACLPSAFLKSSKKKTRTASLALFLLTFSLHISWETAQWLTFLNDWPNITMASDDMLGPVPMRYTLLQSILIWSCLCVLPFLISQQVYSCVILLATILYDAIKAMHHQIKEEIKHFEEINVNFLAAGENDFDLAGKKVMEWKGRHTQMLLFCERINHFFSLILFVIYGLDFITVVSFASGIVKSERTDVDYYLYLCWSVLIFLIYGTVFLLPLVLVYEKVSICWSAK
jgi:hypothetical protein